MIVGSFGRYVAQTAHDHDAARSSPARPGGGILAVSLDIDTAGS